MKRIAFNIFQLIILIAIASCAMTKKENDASEAMEYTGNAYASDYEMENVFTAETIRREDLRTYEQRAVQKLADLYDYIEILSNPEYDSVLRKNTFQTALSLFSDPKATILLDTNSENAGSTIYVSELLNEYLHSKEKIVPFQIENVTIEDSLNISESGQYIGSISFILKNDPKQNGTIKNADIVLKKIIKTFGNEQQRIWEIFISNIN